ncbi:SphA family protein [Methylocella silvestris]|nr:transporter [Methylocella silvestris]
MTTAGAAEYGLGNYLLGYQIPLSGYTPPPGFYYSNTFYLYEGSAGANLRIPRGNIIGAGLQYQFVMNISQFSWVTDLKALGGAIGFAALIPLGGETTKASVAFTGPRGVSRQLGVSDSVNALGDTAYAAFIGWEAGEHHWNLTLTGFAPTGSYDPNALAITSLNRPGVDLKASYTYLSLTTGIEASGGVGMTFNAVNSATNYQSGEELHVEWALNQHLPFGLAAGVGGYFYQQVTADGGQGDERLGAFKGRVAAVGPLLSYTIKAGEQEVILSSRWFHEFATQNRVRGNSIFASMAFRL